MEGQVAGLATALNSLSVNLDDLGRRDDSLQASEEAASLFRRLVETEGPSYLPSLANAASQKHGGMPSQQFCDQSAPMFQQAGGLDPQSFRAYAASQATASRDQYAVCGKKK